MATNYLPGFMDRGKYYRRRNPEGSFTNDIFGLEERQKEIEVIVYQDKSAQSKADRDKAAIKYRETEDVVPHRENVGRSSSLRRSLSDGKIQKTDKAMTRTPPVATGKENVGTHFKRSPPWTPQKELDGSEDEMLQDTGSTSPRVRNPITGQNLVEADGEQRGNKLEDATNTVIATEEWQKKPRRSCIRVREPPGGKSSIVF